MINIWLNIENGSLEVENERKVRKIDMEIMRKVFDMRFFNEQV